MKKLIVLFLVMAGCKAHIQDGTPVSEPDFVKSNDGSVLTFALDKDDNGYCVMQLNGNDPDKSELLTVDGSLSKYQLGQSLRYMGFDDHLSLSIITTVVVVLGLKDANAIPIYIERFGPVRILGMKVGPAAVAGLVVVGLFHGGKIAYRVIRGKQEGEKGGAQVISALATGMVTAPVVEIILREGRAGQAISDKEVFKISDKKMRRVIARISAMKPKFAGACDHITM